MKIFFNALLYTFLYVIILTLIITILHYFNIINVTMLDIGKLITIAIAVIVGGFRVGKNSIKKGWLEGIKFALLVIVIFLILSLILNFNISLRTIIYYSIILISAMTGGMIGINRRKQQTTEES